MKHRGFTLAEMMMVMLVLSITTMLVVPLAGDDERTRIRAVAELLASDIEEVQSMNLSDPARPTCLVPRRELDGWHVATNAEPDVPVSDIAGEPHRRRMGSGLFADAGDLEITPPDLPGGILGFDDQGAPMVEDSVILFRITGTSGSASAEISLSSTGRVSISMETHD